jgi:hypothetical protein
VLPNVAQLYLPFASSLKCSPPYLLRLGKNLNLQKNSKTISPWHGVLCLFNLCVPLSLILGPGRLWALSNPIPLEKVEDSDHLGFAFGFSSHWQLLGTSKRSAANPYRPSLRRSLIPINLDCASGPPPKSLAWQTSFLPLSSRWFRLAALSEYILSKFSSKIWIIPLL